MNPVNYYRFGSYAILAMGLINLRYQTGSQGNLTKSSVLIIFGLLAFIATFAPVLENILLKPKGKLISLLILTLAIAYGLII
jgi:hypothetical protein